VYVLRANLPVHNRLIQLIEFLKLVYLLLLHYKEIEEAHYRKKLFFFQIDERIGKQNIGNVYVCLSCELITSVEISVTYFQLMNLSQFYSHKNSSQKINIGLV
jgi:hypothetical protein